MTDKIFREKMIQTFLNSGFSSFDERGALELLLYFSVKKDDPKLIAQRLMQHFGTIAAVFDSTTEELLTIEGVDKDSALLIKLIPQIARRYLVSKTNADFVINGPKKAGEYLLPYFFGELNETFYMVCLDFKGRVLNCRKMFTGDINSTSLSIRNIVSNALGSNAAAVVVAHNHPSGFALPSNEDVETTRKIEIALASVGVTLVDHIVVADDDFISFFDNGYFEKSKKELQEAKSSHG